jgi:hypothetical protein
VIVYSPAIGPELVLAGIVTTPVDESIVKRVFIPDMPGWLIVKTPPGGVPVLMTGEKYVSIKLLNGQFSFDSNNAL